MIGKGYTYYVQALEAADAHRQREEMRKAGLRVDVEDQGKEYTGRYFVAAFQPEPPRPGATQIASAVAPTENEATQACYDKWKAGQNPPEEAA